MRQLSLLALLLLPGLAGAEDLGERAFVRQCAGCHTLNPPPAQLAQFNKMGARRATRITSDAERRVELGEVIHQRTVEQLEAWLKNPSLVKKKARCDTQGLLEAERHPLMAYLALSVKPPPKTREQLLQEQLEKDIAEQRSAKKSPKPTAPSSSPTRPAQGKK
ncbi:hypothetical protein LZ198_09125 [Myxococcus sp. K15C18031901]|uniref:c-type cytochrome n=1 Tax=Myxococcus dinghuensis TaxID=2906761 RepID=UPI0020A805B1|nr:hypothetical protein [Myxococcus dinghuensis]MCP3099034.1 hypothetical protein [Myxococcus dinghuensis]